MKRKKLPYRDAALSIDLRVEDLLGRMTLEEKAGQLVLANGAQKNIREVIERQKIGAMLQIMGDDCEIAISAARESRLGIPLLLGVDAIHGFCQYRGATIFPSQLGMAQSWDTDLIHEIGLATAREMFYCGVNWTFSPVLCVARDLRWGRIGETFGEDTFLIGKFGAALIQGLQNGEQLNCCSILACAKHYAGYSETQGGRDASEGDTSPRKLLSWFLPPFLEAKNAGVGSFMTGYQSIDGVPATANSWLLKNVLRDQWGFDGFVVTDWNNVGAMVNIQKISTDFEQASALAVHCGNDLVMSTPEFFDGCLSAVRSGALSMDDLDQAVRRILTVKFKLGLFEHDRLPDPALATKQIACQTHRQLALRAARESIVLLHNDGILPLKMEPFTQIALLGANADHGKSMNGDWSYGTGQTGCREALPDGLVSTVRDGLQKQLGKQLIYAAGCKIEPGDSGTLKEAKTVLDHSDLAIVVVGDRIPFWGEKKSTATLELMGTQKQLLSLAARSKKAFIIVVISSKPLIIPETIRKKAAAIIQCFSPGMAGGEALADILLGKFNPCGRLTVSIPYHGGQLPIFYQQIRGQHGSTYADMPQMPCYPFGFGLSYSPIEYRNAQLNKSSHRSTETIKLYVTLKNGSERDAVEVVQVYVSDLLTSVSWADQELKGFQKVALSPQEEREVEIVIPASSCSIVNGQNQRVVEPGEFELRIGSSSSDIHFRLPCQING